MLFYAQIPNCHPVNSQQHRSSGPKKSAHVPFPYHSYEPTVQEERGCHIWVLTSTRCLHSGFASDFLSVWGAWIRMMPTSQVQFLDHLSWSQILKKGPPLGWPLLQLPQHITTYSLRPGPSEVPQSRPRQLSFWLVMWKKLKCYWDIKLFA